MTAPRGVESDKGEMVSKARKMIVEIVAVRGELTRRSVEVSLNCFPLGLLSNDDNLQMCDSKLQ